MDHEPRKFGAGDADDVVARRGRMLVLIGLLPFAVLSLWLFGIPAEHPWRADTILLLEAYSALILSFLGGIRWGLAMRSDGMGAPRDVAASCLPPLAGWMALFMPTPHAFALFAVAFAAQGAWDNFAVHRGEAPLWFGRVRIPATVLAVASMLLAFAATA